MLVKGHLVQKLYGVILLQGAVALSWVYKTVERGHLVEKLYGIMLLWLAMALVCVYVWSLFGEEWRLF